MASWPVLIDETVVGHLHASDRNVYQCPRGSAEWLDLHRLDLANRTGACLRRLPRPRGTLQLTHHFLVPREAGAIQQCEDGNRR
jgi:hypothetical protein